MNKTMDWTKAGRRLVWLAAAALIAFACVAAVGSLARYEMAARWVGAEGGATFNEALFAGIVSRLRGHAFGALALALGVIVLRGPAASRTGRYLSDLWRNAAEVQTETGAAIARFFRAEGRFHLAALAVVLAAGAAFRGVYLRQPINYDEAFTLLFFSFKPLAVGLSDYRAPNNHLLHTLLTHFVYVAVGDRLWVLRLPAFLAGWACIPCVYALGRKLAGKDAGLFAAALTAGSAMMVRHSVVARGYSMMVLFFLLLCLLALRIRKRPDDPFAWTGFVLAATLGFYALPTMLYPFGAVSVWLFILLFPLPRKTRSAALMKYASATAATAAATYALYAPAFIASGFDAVVRNRFVRSMTWAEYSDRFVPFLHLAWSRWLAGTAPVLSAVLIGGFVIFQFRLANRRGAGPPLFVLGTAFCLAAMTLQRALPYERTFGFLYCAAAVECGAGLAWLTGRIFNRAGAVREAAAAVLSLAALGAMVFGAARSRDVTHSNEFGGLRDAEAIVTMVLQDYREGDRVLSFIPSSMPLLYYARKHGLPGEALVYSYPEREGPRAEIQRLYVTANRSAGQTVDGLLRGVSLEGQGFAGLQREGTWESADVYVAERKVRSGSGLR